jgi:hypothetical protein
MPAWAEERKRLLDDLRLGLAGEQPTFPLARLLDVELILTLYAEHLPGEDPEAAWAVLNGHPFPALLALAPEAHRAVELARLQLRSLPGREAWQENLARYQGLAAPLPAYAVEGKGVRRVPTPVAPDRIAAMQAALRTPPPPTRRPARYAGPGRHWFHVQQEPYEANLSEAAAACARRPVPELPPRAPRQRPVLKVPLEELRATARWMDANIPSDFRTAHTWAQRLEQFDLHLATADGFSPGDTLTLDGLLHLIGMVGSGKSSLLTVLTVHLARQGLRVVLLLGDVAAILNELALFSALQATDPALAAVPLVGRTTRQLHLNRLHARLAQEPEGKQSRFHADHPGFALLSTTCALNGRVTDAEPFPVGQEPCTRLRLLRTKQPALDCPYLPECPVHEATRRLPDARIWLATPASLLASRPQAPLIPDSAPYAELVLHHADVVLVDEADLVQIQFDDYFAPTEVLIGSRGAWLDDLAAKVPAQVYTPARPLIGRSEEFRRWHSAHENTQHAANQLLHQLRERSGSLREWVGRRHFTAASLLSRVELEITKFGIPAARLTPAREAVMHQGLTLSTTAAPSGIPEEWVAAAREEVLNCDSQAAGLYLRKWLRALGDIPEKQTDRVVQHLLVALTTAILERALYEMLTRWPDVEDVLQLDRGDGGLFRDATDLLRRYVPEPPMGPVLGFQYYHPRDEQRDELRFFRARGVGRSLLYHLHDRLEASHEIAGPHVVLASGTSWAPSSWRYDLHVPAKALLVPKAAFRVGAIQCFFEPVTSPERPGETLRISGVPVPERHRNLVMMTTELARARGNGLSMLEAELARLPSQRQRILLVVGSYEEARVVADQLISLAGTTSHVRVLVPDREAETREPDEEELLRSLLDRFPNTGARYLVAPLQAVERGHNILVDQQAAIGSVYFLVRPFPPPGDLPGAFHRINSWASRFVPTLTGREIGVAGEQLRKEARKYWDHWLSASETYRSCKDRDPLLWTQLVLVWQCIGRLLRGGVSARVIFVDAKWANVSAGWESGAVDTEATSMLIGFRNILNRELESPDPVRRTIATHLYGAFAAGLNDIQGVNYE